MKPHVIVLGGGVAGMSAAHELAERGFRVTVYERQTIPGGKARSFGVTGTGVNNRDDLPAEHGFRFFPGFYRHLPDTMKRIPYGRNREGVFDNLVAASEMLIQFQGRQHVVVPSRFPRSLEDISAVLAASGYLTVNSGLSPTEIRFYSERVWELLTSCEERRAEDLEGVSWWTFIDAANQSAIYQAYLGRTPRVLVAADPQKANTKTVGDVLLQLLFNLCDPGVAADRVLNGPTNEVWIDPWLDYLEDQCKVRYERGATVVGFHCAGGRISGVRIRQNNVERVEVADYYVAALPVEKMAPLVTPAMLARDPTLQGIQTLAGHVDWMSGIQFYLRTEVPVSYGHQMFLSSPWALTSISQAQFWADVRNIPRDYGDGTVRTVLSVDVSDWKNTPGTNGKLAIDCTRDEVGWEVWKQLKDTLSGLADADLHPTTRWHLDPAIKEGGPALTNDEELLVNRPNTWALRPWARTRIPNLFLASDYVRTYTNLATMEAANEAARRAVNAIIDASGSRAEPCELWHLSEPPWVKPWRAWDLFRYRRGESWGAAFPDFVEAMARSVLETAPSIGDESDYADAVARETVENGVGVVPPYVQEEAADLVMKMVSALRVGDIPALRRVLAPDAKIAVDGERIDVNVAIEKLEPFVAGGGRIDVDIRSLEYIQPDERLVHARFDSDTVVSVDSQTLATSSGHLEIWLDRSAAQAAPVDRWLITRVMYRMSS